MDLVSENCTSAAIFSHGKIHSVGTPKEIFSSYEELEKLGLDIPVTAYLTRALEKVGVSVDNDLTVDGFINAVCDQFSEVK